MSHGELLMAPDGWMSGWLLNSTKPQSRIRRQQGGGGVVIWAGIMNDAIVGPFAVPDGVNMNAKSYVEFLKKNFLPWYRKQQLALKRKMIFMHDNSPSHAALHFWLQLKSKVYEGGRQFSSKKDLWEQIQTSAAAINKDSIKQLTNSIDSRLLKVVTAKWGYIHY